VDGREQVAALRREFDPVLDEPPPQRLRVPPLYWTRPLLRYAAVVAWLTLGGVIGWQLHAYTADQRAEAISWPRRAAIAHVVYSPEVRHPVEVGADQEAHLVTWLSKRLGAPLKVPGIVPKLGATPGELEWVGPKLGAHTDEILGRLGYSLADIAGLRARKIV